MPVPILEVLYECIWDEAVRHAPLAMRQTGLPRNKFCPEDVAGEFVEKFIRKGFLAKFDHTKGSFQNYIHLGVNRAAVSLWRHWRRELQSLDEMLKSDEDGHNLALPAPPIVEDLVMDELFAGYVDFPFGRNVTVELVDAEGNTLGVFTSRVSSIVKMLYMNYDKKEIARMFKVSVATINRALEFFKEQMDAMHPGKFRDVFRKDEEMTSLFF